MNVVVVDPSRTVLKCVTQTLESGHHTVHPFTDGPPALQFLMLNAQVDSLITSIELPSMSGLDLCREARAVASARRPIYVLIMSASSDRTKLIRALDQGADDFIGKPPASEELFARLRAAERLACMQRELARMADMDPLTECLNRRAFFETVTGVFADLADGAPRSAIMLDIDHFKRINDNYGHGAGDQVIRRVAQEAMAEAEIVGRFGGEEFALVLPNRTRPEAQAVAERLRRRLSRAGIRHQANLIAFTASFGVSEWRPDDNIDRMLNRADRALYAAKARGRDCVVVDNELASEENQTSMGITRSDERSHNVASAQSAG